MRKTIYIATFNLFFCFNAQPLFIFIVTIIFIIITLLSLQSLQLLLLSLVIAVAVTVLAGVLSSLLLSSVVVALIKYQYHLLYQPLFLSF